MDDEEIDLGGLQLPDFSFDSGPISLEPPPVQPLPVASRKIIKSPFVIEIDSNERGHAFPFSGIVGDFRDSNAAIEVQVVRKRLRTGDYMIQGFPSGITIERKSRDDLFGSVHPGPRRDDFIDRLRRMDENFEHAVVLMECYPEHIVRSEWTSLHPNMVRRTPLSWAQQFPNVHWHWGGSRAAASELCYRILEKFYEHKVNERYKHHNKPIDRSLAARREGEVARLNSDVGWVPYPPGNHLRLDWMSGWAFISSHVCGGEAGRLNEGPPPAEGAESPPAGKARKKKAKPSDPMAEMREFFGLMLK